MREKGGVLAERNDEKIREVNASDISPSEPTKTKSPFVQEDSPMAQSGARIPEGVRQAAHKRSLAQRVREEHDGEGYVIINTQSAEIIDVADDLREATIIIKSAGLPSDNTLIVSCHER